MSGEYVLPKFRQDPETLKLSSESYWKNFLDEYFEKDVRVICNITTRRELRKYNCQTNSNGLFLIFETEADAAFFVARFA